MIKNTDTSEDGEEAQSLNRLAKKKKIRVEKKEKSSLDTENLFFAKNSSTSNKNSTTGDTGKDATRQDESKNKSEVDVNTSTQNENSNNAIEQNITEITASTTATSLETASTSDIIQSNNSKDSDSNLNSNSTQNIKKNTKKKDKKLKKNNTDNTLENLFGNGGIIVITQSFINDDDVK